MTTIALPSHLPSSTASRRTGRARIESITPDSTSPEIVGEVTKTAVMPTMKLNMNITITRNCATSTFTCASSAALSRAIDAKRSKPQPTPSANSSVRTVRTSTTRRRSVSRIVSSTIVVSPVICVRARQRAR